MRNAPLFNGASVFSLWRACSLGTSLESCSRIVRFPSDVGIVQRNGSEAASGVPASWPKNAYGSKCCTSPEWVVGKLEGDRNGAAEKPVYEERVYSPGAARVRSDTSERRSIC
jgi:hypothetical protein